MFKFGSWLVGWLVGLKHVDRGHRDVGEVERVDGDVQLEQLQPPSFHPCCSHRWSRHELFWASVLTLRTTGSFSSGFCRSLVRLIVQPFMLDDGLAL